MARVEGAVEVRFEGEPAAFGFTGHPLPGEVAEFALLIAAADIGVHAGEPHLLQVDAWLGRPQGGLEVLAVFVDGNGVAGVANDAAGGGVVEQVARGTQGAEERGGYAQRANGVPHADEFDLGLVRYGMLAAKVRGLALGGGGALGALTIELVGLVHSLGALAPEQAAVADEPRQGANGVGAAAEAEQEELIAGLVVVHDEAIAIHDVLVDAGAGGATAYSIAFGAHALVVIDDLLGAGLTIRSDAACQTQYVCGVIAFGTLPGTIGADDDALHLAPSLRVSYKRKRHVAVSLRELTES